jgi:hypothetical protein
VDAVAERLKAQKRAGAEERIPPQTLAADDTFKEERPLALLDFAKGAHGRKAVAEQLAVDGHEAGVFGQLGELFERRVVSHGSLEPLSPVVRCPRSVVDTIRATTDRGQRTTGKLDALCGL